MSTTGAIIAGTGTSVARSTGTAWTNPGNITADDGTNASCNSGSTGSAYLRASNFGFNIPAGSLIQGFTVVFEMAEASAGGETVSVQIVDQSGAAAGNAKTQSVNNNNSMTAYTLGSSTDVWGTTLTAADINDTDFGVYLWYTTTHNTTVDYISIEVNYAPPITGTLAATESGSDTASINGDVIVQGSLAVTETGSDTATINGIIQAAGITGSLAATETGSDTASIQGDVFISGSLTATETGLDTATVSGKVLVQGSIAVTETGSDTAEINGFLTAAAITGSLAAIETGSDTASVSGKVFVQGNLEVTEIGSDTAALAGKVLVQGNLTVSEIGTDTAIIDGQVFIQGALNATEEGLDIADISGFGVRNRLEATEEGTDTADVSGTVLVTGSLGATETVLDSAFINAWVYYEYPLPENVLEGVRYGPGGIYVGTAAAVGTRVEIASGRIVKLIGKTGAYLT